MLSRASARTILFFSSHVSSTSPSLPTRHSLRFLSSSTPYPLYYELISYQPAHPPKRRRRSTLNAHDKEHEEQEKPLDRAKRKYYRKREKRLYGEPELERESGPSEFVELDPQIVDFPRLHAREEELYFYDAMAFPWEKEKHYKMVYQLEKKYFPDQSLDKAFLEVVADRGEEKQSRREKGLVFFEKDGQPGNSVSGKKMEERQSKREKGLVFFEKEAGQPGKSGPGKGGEDRESRREKGLIFSEKKDGQSGNSGSEKKVEEFFNCLKKVPGGGSGASSDEPWLASRKTGLPPRWDGPSGTVLLVDKPKGWTSFTVCGKLRRLVKVQKVGHAGTLDPMATGLLIVCVGKATKVVDRYQAMFKSYSGIFRLGEATSTWDADSPIIQREPWEHIKDDDIKKAAESFSGEIWQVPPMFSAIKVGGEKMYEKARRGETVELSPRRISIFQFDIERSLADRQDLVFRVICSKGTYIRSLCADFGKALGRAILGRGCMGFSRTARADYQGLSLAGCSWLSAWRQYCIDMQEFLDEVYADLSCLASRTEHL